MVRADARTANGAGCSRQRPGGIESRMHGITGDIGARATAGLMNGLGLSPQAQDVLGMAMDVSQGRVDGLLGGLTDQMDLGFDAKGLGAALAGLAMGNPMGLASFAMDALGIDPVGQVADALGLGGLKDAVDGFADDVGEALGGIGDAVGEAVGGFADAVGDAVGGIADAVGDAIGGVADAVGDARGGKDADAASGKDADAGKDGADAAGGADGADGGDGDGGGDGGGGDR